MADDSMLEADRIRARLLPLAPPLVQLLPLLLLLLTVLEDPGDRELLRLHEAATTGREEKLFLRVPFAVLGDSRSADSFRLFFP